MHTDMNKRIKEFKEHLTTTNATMQSIGPSLEIAANFCIDTLNNNGKMPVYEKLFDSDVKILK